MGGWGQRLGARAAAALLPALLPPDLNRSCAAQSRNVAPEGRVTNHCTTVPVWGMHTEESGGKATGNSSTRRAAAGGMPDDVYIRHAVST